MSEANYYWTYVIAYPCRASLYAENVIIIYHIIYIIHRWLNCAITRVLGRQGRRECRRAIWYFLPSRVSLPLIGYEMSFQRNKPFRAYVRDVYRQYLLGGTPRVKSRRLARPLPAESLHNPLATLTCVRKVYCVFLFIFFVVFIFIILFYVRTS